MIVRRLGIAILLCGFVLVADGQAAGTTAALALLQKQYQQRHAEFAAEMETLAAGVGDASPRDVASGIRELIPPLEEQSADVDALPSTVQSEISESLSEEERALRTQLRRIRAEYAEDLFGLSRRAVHLGHVSFAFHLLREVAFHNPDHPTARQQLGYVRYEDRWVTPFELSMLKRGYVRHDAFGWLPESHVERYIDGQRFVNGRWMTAPQEAAIRSNFADAWEIESDHFLIKTNQSLERGVQLSSALEKFHQFFRREFASIFDSPQQMRQLFATAPSAARRRSQRHEVHYYQSRQEFVARLRAKQPGIEVSNG
ncbi:MAG: hypothetical protein KF861_14470, partial [Planctomycetaceae bacterium]|nr:hypothetical protein [Planctomycetaceae bacterium]